MKRILLIVLILSIGCSKEEGFTFSGDTDISYGYYKVDGMYVQRMFSRAPQLKIPRVRYEIISGNAAIPRFLGIFIDSNINKTKFCVYNDFQYIGLKADDSIWFDGLNPPFLKRMGNSLVIRGRIKKKYDVEFYMDI